MKIGLFFGSFNPPHIGHLIIANHILEYTNIQKIWFVVSPQNPFKNSSDLIEGQDRLIMTKLAIEDYENMKVCDIEFYLPRPSYTINTLNILDKKYPKECFHLIIGEDLIRDFSKWEGSNIIIERYKPYMCPRFPFQDFKDKNSKIHYVKSPLIEISSTFIRSCIRERKNIRPFLSSKVWKYVINNHLYK